MSTFRIGYKSYFRESSEHHSDYISAQNATAALKAFAKEHKIPQASRQKPEKWEWWDGEHLYQFRAIEPAKTVPCPHCCGTGETETNDAEHGE